jgi:NADH:ubiquinone oxidoreductase subunit F (NADH-binding)
VDGGGGRGLAAARLVDPEAVIAEIEESGLTARGGAGAPCGPKWRTGRAYATGAAVPPSVVVNAAEGEPGSFKDRAILFRNPYQVIEGALIAAYAIGACDVIIALKRMHGKLRGRLAEALDEARAAGWLDGIEVQLFEGPNEYLYGEETAMLEAIDGRPPFPRIAPPYRRGVHEIVDPLVAAESVGAEPAHIQMAGPSTAAFGSPTLVNNVETLANVPAILVEGPEWFRSIGTPESPGTLVCTVTGATRGHGVGEVPMGTSLRDVIDLIGGGPNAGRTIKAVMGGAATPVLTADQLDTPVSNEGMRNVGGMLGCGGFIVFDDHSDMAAVAAGVARFLSVESCGLCVPCKEDGLSLARLFDRVRMSQASDHDLATIHDCLQTVTEGSRCTMATQYPLVLQSILDNFGDEIDGHLRGTIEAAKPELIASIVDIDGTWAYLDETHRDKQPDWTFETRWSGKSPADRLSTAGSPRPR